MGKICYLIGDTVDARQRLLDKKIASDEYPFFLHFIPTRGRVIELESDRRFWLKRKINTLTSWIYRLFDVEIKPKQFSGQGFINDSVRLLLIKKIMAKRWQEPDGLTYFSKLLTNSNQTTDFTGIYRAIANFFSLIIRNNFEDIFVQEVERRILRFEEGRSEIGEERYALESDLVWLFGDFEEIKKEIQGYDEDDVISSVRSFLQTGSKTSLVTNKDVLLFDGFIYLSRIEEDILFHLFNRAKEVWWLLDYHVQTKDPLAAFKESSVVAHNKHQDVQDEVINHKVDWYDEYRIFAPMVSFMDRLEKSGIKHCVELATPELSSHSVVGHFSFFKQTDNNTMSSSLKVKSFKTRADEVRAIAGEVKRIIHEEGLDTHHDLKRIRIIFPNLNDYTSLISEIFSAHGIPFSLTKGLPAMSHPFSEIFKNIFEIPLNHFNRKDIFRLFSSNLIYHKTDNEPIKLIDLKRFLDQGLYLKGDEFSFVQQLVKSGSKGDFFQQLNIFLFDGIAKKCGLTRLEIYSKKEGHKDFIWIKDFYQEILSKTTAPKKRHDLKFEYYRFLAQIMILQQKLMPMMDLLSQDNPQVITDIFLNIIEMFGFPENIISIPNHSFQVEMNPFQSMLKRDVKAYTLLKDLLQKSLKELQIQKDLFHVKGGYELLSGFYSLYKANLNNTYILDERDPNVIRISQWLETRGRCFDYIFAGGITADRFPIKEETSFILSDSYHTVFRKPDPIDEARYLFSHVLRNHRKRLYLSYPRFVEEKEVQPSPMLMDLESIVKREGFTANDTGYLEDIFPWEDHSYITLKEDLLNATISKDSISKGVDDRPFPMKRVIVEDSSEIEGLIRGINSLISRWASDGLFEYDGQVGASSRFKEFKNVKDKVFSPSKLESLAYCPMRYLFQDIYDLRIIMEKGVEASRMDLGEHIHVILKNYFSSLRKEGKNVADIGLDKAFLLAKQIAGHYLNNVTLFKGTDFFESQKRELLEGLERHAKAAIAESDLREGIIAKFLRFEQEAFSDRIPQGLEYAFGKEEGSPVTLGKTRFRGYIDRFDVDKADQEKVFLYDYKTGQIPSSDMIKRGFSFQLPVYMRALRSDISPRSLSASFYSLKRDILIREYPLKQTIRDHSDDEDGLDISGVSLIDEYADRLMALMDKGMFHHAEDETNCHYCEFRYACHKDVRRLSHLLNSEMDYGIYSGRKNIQTWKKVDDLQKRWRDTLVSMRKAFDLKTLSGRSGHFEKVMKFNDFLTLERQSLPFQSDYIDELIKIIKDFKEKYSSSSTTFHTENG